MPHRVGRGPHYELFADEFAAHAEDSPYNAYLDRPAVLDLLGDVSGLSVLDAGCGPGLYAAEVVRRGGRVTGFDQSARLVQLAAERVPDGDFRQHDLADPLEWAADESFDRVILALVIHHIDDRLRALRELHRVLRPGGALIVSTHHPTADWLRRSGGFYESSLHDEMWHSTWKVRFWQQPLEATCTEFAEAGFLIERLTEPRPMKTLESISPEVYRTLTTKPSFMAFRLIRR